jgi:phosphocarrier protein
MSEERPPLPEHVASLTILNNLGLHARAAALLAETASRYQAQVTISKDGHAVDAKSILELMLLAAAQGARIEVRAVGTDAGEAIDAIRELVDLRFHEKA